MSLAGLTLDVTLTGFEKQHITLTPGDLTRFERVYKTAVSRLADDQGNAPMWAIYGVVQSHLLRKGVIVPTDLDDFVDLVVDVEVVDAGKAEGSDPTPTTG